MTTHDKMLTRLRTVLHFLPEGTILRSTHAGSIQRCQGAWSWQAFSAEGEDLKLGSHHPMTTLLAHEWLIVTRAATGDLEVDPLITPLHCRNGPVLAIA